MPPLTPLTITTSSGTTSVAWYRQREWQDPRAARATGPTTGGSITRLAGDLLPVPAPVAFDVIVPPAAGDPNTLDAAYSAAYDLLEQARAATRVTWHGGAVDVHPLIRASMTPDGPAEILLTLEWIPKGPNPGPLLDGMTRAWTARTGTSTSREVITNDHPAFTRPSAPAQRVTYTGSANYHRATIDLADAPATPDEIDVAAILRPNYTPGGGSGIGVTLGNSTNAACLNVGSTTVTLQDYNAYAVKATASPSYAVAAGETWALRMHAKRDGVNTYTVQGRAWSARTHPSGEPGAWLVTATGWSLADLTRAGAGGAIPSSQHVDVLAFRVAFDGTPAWIERP